MLPTRTQPLEPPPERKEQEIPADGQEYHADEPQDNHPDGHPDSQLYTPVRHAEGLGQNPHAANKRRRMREQNVQTDTGKSVACHFGSGNKRPQRRGPRQSVHPFPSLSNLHNLSGFSYLSKSWPTLQECEGFGS